MAADSENSKTVVLKRAPEDGEKAAVPETLPVKPQKRYRFLRTIGFGGMKSVLLVYDTDTGREVAMAMMPDFRSRPEGDLRRFVAEALLTARLEHPNIVPVHDVGMDESGSPFFTMKYLQGQSLARLLRRLKSEEQAAAEGYSLHRRLRIFTRVCNAVAFAHSQGICHLDLKPENVNIGNFGEVLVLDWGLAMPEDKLAAAGIISGTPGYMAPERIAGERMDKRSDIYSLGCILYAVLTFREVSAGLPADEKLRRAVNGKIESPSKAAGHAVPPALEAVCLKAMSVKKNDRYSSVNELLEDIFAYTAGFAVNAEHATALRKTQLFFARHAAAAAVVTLLLIIAVMAWALLRG